MRLSERSILRISRLLRPFMRHKTPGLYRLCRLLLGALCPRGSPYRLVTDYDGGLIQVDTASVIGFSLLFRGCHEPEVARLLARLIRRGHVCLDVGAHIGSHTLIMARAAGPEGRVIALEPHPELCRQLLENVALNRLDNVRVVRAALAEADGTAAFFGFDPAARNRGISSLLPGEHATERLQVQTVTGKTLEERLGLEALDFVKIDVEGAERIVLEQLFGLIDRHRPCIVFEYQKQHWDRFGSSTVDVLGRLRALEYVLYRVRDDVTQPLTGDVQEDCELVCIPASRETPLEARPLPGREAGPGGLGPS